MDEVQSPFKICVKIGPKNVVGQKNEKFHSSSNFYDPVKMQQMDKMETTP